MPINPPKNIPNEVQLSEPLATVVFVAGSLAAAVVAVGSAYVLKKTIFLTVRNAIHIVATKGKILENSKVLDMTWIHRRVSEGS